MGATCSRRSRRRSPRARTRGRSAGRHPTWRGSARPGGRRREQLGTSRDRRARWLGECRPWRPGGRSGDGRSAGEGDVPKLMSQPEMAVGAVPVAGTRRFPLVHALLLAATALTTAMASTLARGFDPIADPRQLIHGIPFAATLITILLVHESGHYLMCRRYGVAASLPYFIPGLPP